jgi:hypothetical protein
MKLFYVLLMTLVTLTNVSYADVAYKRDIAAKNKVLNARPSGPAYAGVLPVYYHSKSKKYYVLLSREAFNGSKDCPQGTYCDFGGKVDFDKNRRRYHRFVTAALNELYEESAGIYNFRGPRGEKLLKNEGQIYYTLNRPFKKVMTYAPVRYVKRADMLRKRNHLKRKHASHHLYEKDDFIWVEAKSLHQAIHALRPGSQHQRVHVRILNDNGHVTSKTIRLRGMFTRSLIESKQILTKYI